MCYYFSEFGVHLVELTLDRNGTLPIRQLSSVLLKQYVEAHWSQDSDKVRFNFLKCFSENFFLIKENLFLKIHSYLYK